MISQLFSHHKAARLGAATVSGILLVVIFPLPAVPGVVWIACLPLLLALAFERNLGLGFLWGLIAGIVFLGGSLYWFVEVMQSYGGLTLVEALAAMLLFLVLFAPFWGAFGLLESLLARRSAGAALVAAPFLWVALELARTYLITGFPWNLLGYSIQSPGIEQLATVTGVYGLSFVAVAASALLAWFLLKPRSVVRLAALAAWAAALIAAHFAMAPPRLAPPEHLAVLVQPDVPLDEAQVVQWAPWRNPAPLAQLVRLSEQTAEQNADHTRGNPLIVWSENSAPFFFDRGPIFRTALETMAREAHADVIANTITFVGGDTEKPQNTAVVLNPEGSLTLEYHKVHLVPMGEYVPSWLRFTRMSKVTAEVSDFIPGDSYPVAHTPEGSIGVFICYEAIFPQLVRRLVRPGPGVLVNISDDAWYGASAARFQHLNMARFRAIENRRYLLRATNDGITAVIDPYGRIAAAAPLYRQAALPARFSLVGSSTFYTAHGDVFAWVCVALSGAAILVGSFLPKRGGNAEF